ncbi:MAG: ATP-dependent helicase [SAR324 cluster bacterium]|nr:ATP-dependent helicase [SAR324 cluster bacterium]
MINIEEFYKIYQQPWSRNPNNEQKEAIEKPANSGLFIVAGPGTGKTTCLTLRILKLILVDGISPKGILATTFTKKAAAELRSRILSWGFRLIETLEKALPNKRDWLQTIDINQVTTGTIDSICEQILRDFRDPGTLPPVLIDEYVSKTILLREGLLSTGYWKDHALENFLLELNGGQRFGFNLGKKNDLLISIWQRRFQDQIQWNDFVQKSPANEREVREKIDAILNLYHTELKERQSVDFTLLEQEVLTRLVSGQLQEFLSQIQVVLVDEYQDTNLLQERIYFEFAKACKGALNVVGDDDQSLYRFRGATVELFSNFQQRYKTIFHQSPHKIFLKTNYRSTPTIIEFVNNYAELDSAYQSVRVKTKPRLLCPVSQSEEIPILAMFRPDTNTLGRDLSDFIRQVFRGTGYTLKNGLRIECNRESGGDVGDCAILCSSPLEFKQDGKPRLPHLLRDYLNRDIEVFNPRGEDLTGIPLIQQFAGLILQCLDPGGVIENETSGLNQGIQDIFREWRDIAVAFANGKKAPSGLLDFVTGWENRDPNQKGWKWPQTVAALDLIYGLVHFFPQLYDDPEGQVYLEVFTRQVSACEQIGKFSGRVVYDPDNEKLSTASVKELLRDFLGPIASGTIKVNEELMEAFPRDRLNILSIHQSKGLEFPMIIVDIGSDFSSNHHGHRFKRHPDKGGVSHLLENLLRPYSSLQTPVRPEKDRAFDDLYRQFFVAYSRPEQILILVGLNETAPGGKAINVATGWDRGSNCLWNHQTFMNL